MRRDIMSWTRAELKARAKAAFHRNYWVCVLVAFILCFVGGNSGGGSCNTGSSSSSSSSSYYNDYDYDYDDYNDYNYGDYDYDYDDDYDSAANDLFNTGALAIFGAMTVVVLVICLIAGVLGILLSAFVFNPFQVGGCYFFLENAVSNNASVGGIIAGFKTNYKGTVITMFLRNLYIGLWSLLLFIPGIIKSYEYRMIPYILADHPEMEQKEVFALSKQMMDGEKWNAFVLDLSFIGWEMLAALTCGILSIFYVNPYVHATNAELYLALKRNKCQPAYGTYGSVYGSYDNNVYGSSYDNSYGNNTYDNSSNNSFGNNTYDNSFNNTNNTYDSGFNNNGYTSYDNNSFNNNTSNNNDSSNDSYNPYT